MPLPRVRLRLWWMMAVIAAVGLLLGAWVEVPRLREASRIRREWAEQHARLEQRGLAQLKVQVECQDFWSALAAEREKKADTFGSPKPDAVESWSELASQATQQAAWHAQQVASLEKEATYHGRMRRKWQRAAIYPWLSVEHDPPSPGR